MKPVAYIDSQDLERLPHHDCWVNGQEHKNSVPLYTHPVKELTDEEVIQIASELKIVYYYGETGDWSGVTNEDMIEKEKHINNERLLEILKPFAKAILRKAQEK